ncbi:ABC transporter permease subunit [Mesobacillus sp. AQ2]|jgi:ABC-2 type transport system permease protein|uniref:ABC transporter permease n=1 Tax=Bacillaceae TaxID=186817 RepID=UPI0011A9266B|nr:MULTISPECIES: ABC transporter permease subunit [Bacillaceae]MCM3121835.1 ABC transporter permease [Mesobacillus sp. MER 33]MCM3231799.1 ABC transporter permease [Mesobacillus sp. MER 48]WHX38766.1 ABC transporter permease subunit [Mesobacillus sp. AQ2]
MIGLIQNELMKIFGKMASWIYMVIIVLAVLIAGIIYMKVSADPNPNWRQDTEAEIAMLENQLASASNDEKAMIQNQIDQTQEFLDEDINPNAKTNWHFMNDVVVGVSSLVTLFVVVVGSANVAAEFSDGTIKQLLIRPHHRWRILLSKYIAVIIYALMLVITLIVSGYIIGLVLFGSGDFNMKIFEITLEGRKVAIVGEQFLLKMLYFIPSLLMIMTIAFMLSTLFKSQALAVGIGIFVLFFSSTLGGIILMLADKYTWAKFLIFPHLDLTVYALQERILEDITLPVSLSILAVYYAIFMMLTFFFFQKRDISI